MELPIHAITLKIRTVKLGYNELYWNHANLFAITVRSLLHLFVITVIIVTESNVISSPFNLYVRKVPSVIDNLTGYCIHLENDTFQTPFRP